MRFERINYTIEPSFAGSSVCEIASEPQGMTYAVTIQDGNGYRQIQASPETILPILNAVERLSLPVPADVAGLDGTIYSLRIGLVNSVTYSWWQRLPSEWSSLQGIIAAIEAVSGIKEQQS